MRHLIASTARFGRIHYLELLNAFEVVDSRGGEEEATTIVPRESLRMGANFFRTYWFSFQVFLYFRIILNVVNYHCKNIWRTWLQDRFYKGFISILCNLDFFRNRYFPAAPAFSFFRFSISFIVPHGFVFNLSNAVLCGAVSSAAHFAAEPPIPAATVCDFRPPMNCKHFLSIFPCPPPAPIEAARRGQFANRFCDGETSSYIPERTLRRKERYTLIYFLMFTTI